MVKITDLLLGGSPCQGFSFAGKRLNFDDPRSKLFFDYVKALDELKPKYFLLENVKMKQGSQDVISSYLGVEPIEINSSLVSAQSRKRLYWTNIPNVTLPKDKNIKLIDIIDEDVSIDYKMKDNWAIWFKKNAQFQLKKKYSSLSKDKAITMTTRQYSCWSGTFVFVKTEEFAVSPKEAFDVLEQEVLNNNLVSFTDNKQTYYCSINKSSFSLHHKFLSPNSLNFKSHNKFYYISKDKLIGGYMRKLSPIECERLQTLPDNYTKSVSDAQRYKLLGNGWTVDVIAHILSFIPEKKLRNVVSLFDGISCGQAALKKEGISYERCLASEIDKNAIKVALDNFPNTVHLGDITTIDWAEVKSDFF